MEPYYEDESIQIVQFKGPTKLEEIRQALTAFLENAADHRKFMLELQRAKLDFDVDEASEFFLYIDQHLGEFEHRLVVVILSDEQSEHSATHRLIKKMRPKLEANPHIEFASDLAQAHDLFAAMAAK